MRTATKEQMEKSLDDVHGFLTGKQFRSEPVHSDEPLFRRNRYYRRIDASRLNHLCLCNDRNSLGIEVWWGDTPDGSYYFSITMGIIAETRPDIWVDFKLYSLSAEQLLTQFDELEQLLIRAWNATIDQPQTTSTHGHPELHNQS